jgi:GntR family transcriptional repressor for pyruvate dehydrogenase complex
VPAFCYSIDKMSDQFLDPNQFEDSPYLNPINRTLVVDEVIDRLVALIVNENLKPGDKLPTERELMARLEIGRSSLREAIKTLSEARSVIETALAGWAAERRSDEDIAAIAKLIEKLEASRNEKKAYIQLDLQFHLAVAKAAQNKILFQVLNIFQNLLRVWMETTYDETHGSKDSVVAHRELFEAIRAKDVNAARRGMQIHTSGAPLLSAVSQRYAETQATPDFLDLIKNAKS